MLYVLYKCYVSNLVVGQLSLTIVFLLFLASSQFLIHRVRNLFQVDDVLFIVFYEKVEVVLITSCSIHLPEQYSVPSMQIMNKIPSLDAKMGFYCFQAARITDLFASKSEIEMGYAWNNARKLLVEERDIEGNAVE